VFGAQLPDPTRGYVPPSAFISRVSWHTLLGGVSFGLGMVIAGGCISGQMYRLGEGAAPALVALGGVVAGQMLGQLAWNTLWVRVVADAPAVWLPKEFGYAGSLLLQLVVIAGLAALLLRFFSSRRAIPDAASSSGATTADEPATLRSVLHRVFVRPWPATAGGVAIGVLATFAFFRGAPLGVTAELSRCARAIGNSLGLLPQRLEGLDLVGGCRPPEGVTGLSNPGLFVVALVAGSLAGALAAGEFRPRLGRPRALLLALLGGILLGFGAFVASGCTVGALLSGVMAFSLHGGVFAAGLLGGALAGVFALRSLAPKPAPIVDLRGESCGMPEVRFLKFFAERDVQTPFILLADSAIALEPLLPIASRHGFRGRIERAEDGSCRVEFEPIASTPSSPR